MDRIEDVLTTRLGPFVVWQWLAIAAGGVILSAALSRWWGPSAPAAGDDGLDLAPTGGVGAIDNAATPPAPTTPTTNEEWIKAGVAVLIREGRTGWLSDQALRRYVAGWPLSPEQLSAVDLAIVRIGPPPEGAPAIQLEVPPAGVPDSSLPPPALGPSQEPPAIPPASYIATGAGSGTTEADRLAAVIAAGGRILTGDGLDPDTEPDELLVVAGGTARAPAPGQSQLEERVEQLAALERKQTDAARGLTDTDPSAYAPALAKVRGQVVALTGGKTEAELRDELQRARRERDGAAIQTINAQLRAAKAAAT